MTRTPGASPLRHFRYDPADPIPNKMNEQNTETDTVVTDSNSDNSSTRKEEDFLPEVNRSKYEITTRKRMAEFETNVNEQTLLQQSKKLDKLLELLEGTDDNESVAESNDNKIENDEQSRQYKKPKTEMPYNQKQYNRKPYVQRQYNQRPYERNSYKPRWNQYTTPRRYPENRKPFYGSGSSTYNRMPYNRRSYGRYKRY
jgi:hypothetical protein